MELYLGSVEFSDFFPIFAPVGVYYIGRETVKEQCRPLAIASL